MWKWKHFESIDSLVAFINELELEHHQFKIVNSHAPRRSGPYGSPMYLIYNEHRTNDLPLLEEAEADAISVAERILHDASEGPGQQDAR